MSHTKTISLGVLSIMASAALIFSVPGFASAATPSLVITPVPWPVHRTITLDSKATLTIKPVAKAGSIVSDFSKAFTLNNRPVQLQFSTDKTFWTVVKTGKMDSKGVTTFKLSPSSTATYRVVAQKYKALNVEATTPTATLK